MKKPKNTKNESFNTSMSREKESIIWKVKKTWEIYGKLFGRDEKSRVSKGNLPYSLLFSIMKRKRRSLYNGEVLSQRMPFLSTSLSYPNFLAFSLSFSRFLP